MAPKALSELSVLLGPHLDAGQMRLVSGKYLHVQQSEENSSSPQPPSRGLNLTYLPTFHVICTSDGQALTLKLMTFHGKVVTSFGDGPDQKLTLEDTLEFFKLLDTARLCSGITTTDLVKKNSFRMNVGKYLVEQFEDKVVLRSRQCRFAIAGPDDAEDEGGGGGSGGETVWPQCEECASAQEALENSEEVEDEPQIPLENSYHSIFGSGEKVSCWG